MNRFEISRARRLLAHGYSLEIVANRLGYAPRVVDLALWRALGQKVEPQEARA